jgi:hypothetical protein
LAVSFVLVGTYHEGSFLRRRSPTKMLDDIADWWWRHAPEFEPHVRIDASAVPPTLALTLHPAVEPVTFEITGPGTLAITANTSTGGPGYHRTLINRLRRMARELSIGWGRGQLVEGIGDPTGYFESMDAVVVDDAMLDWAHAIATAAIEQADDGATELAIGMSTDLAIRNGAFANTALGPRDRAFFERIVADRWAGTALFAWWSDDPDAKFYLDRALARMWSEVRWRAPLDDDERATLIDVDRDLERATAGEAGDIPWPEWDEIRGLLGKPPVGRPDRWATEPDAEERAPIGYRRGLIGARYGDWVLDVPGSMAETVIDGDRVLYDDSANIRVATYERPNREPEESATDAILEYGLTDGRLAAVIDADGVVGWASDHKLVGDEAGFLALQGIAAVPEALAFVTISHAPTIADWAADTFRTLRWQPVHPARQEPGDGAPPPGPAWDQEQRDRVLVQAGLAALLRDEGTPRYVIVERASWVSSGYVQAIGQPDGAIRVELAGARNDPSMADPERVTRADALGWGAAAADAAGNHVIVRTPPVDLPSLADLIVRTLREVHGTPTGGLRIEVDEASAGPG